MTNELFAKLLREVKCKGEYDIFQKSLIHFSRFVYERHIPKEWEKYIQEIHEVDFLKIIIESLDYTSTLLWYKNYYNTVILKKIKLFEK